MNMKWARAFRKWHGNETSRPFGNYDRPIDRPTNRPTDQQTDRRTNRRAHRGVSLPIILRTYLIEWDCEDVRENVSYRDAKNAISFYN